MSEFNSESGTRYRVTIIVAIPDNSNATDKDINALKEGINTIRKMLAFAFGGYTSQFGTGAWAHPDTNEMMVEKNDITFCDVKNVNAIYAIQRKVYDALKGNPACEWVHITAHKVEAFHVQTYKP